MGYVANDGFSDEHERGAQRLDGKASQPRGLAEAERCLGHRARDRDGRQAEVKTPLNRAWRFGHAMDGAGAGRTAVPSSRDFRAPELDELRKRVRELAHAIVDGGTMERSAGSLAASERRTRR
jgi:hypothetical protein